MELSVETFDRICRACLCESTNMKSLFTKNVSEKHSLLELFSVAASLSVLSEDGLPKQVCEDCELIIKKAEEFRKRCLQSDTLLKKVFENANKEQYLDTNQKKFKYDVKNQLFFDKLSDFELQVVDKKDLDDFSQSYGTEDSNKHDISNSTFDTIRQHSVKKEIVFETDEDFGNNFDDNEIETLPIEFKEETQPQKTINFTKYKKLQWKNKKKASKSKDVSIPFKYSCTDCKIDFEDIKLWQNHVQTHSFLQRIDNDNDKSKDEERLLQCSLCFRKCKTKKTLSKHMKLHERTDNIKYSCDKCKREFKYKSFLESHVISIHMHTEFTCHICSEKFTNKESLEVHIDSHQEKKKHVCSICSKGFIMSCTLKDHMRKHTGEKPFLCCTCGKGFSQKTNLAQHTRRHLGVKPFKCDICPKGFVSKGELEAHGRKHSGAHPFLCESCTRGFTTASALRKHRRIHTGERPFACDLCPLRFAASGTLKNHRRTHTGERPFQCSLCEKAFVQRTDLISHIRCHTGERPYVCPQCGQAFRKTAALKTHLKMHGKELLNAGMPGVCC